MPEPDNQIPDATAKGAAQVAADTGKRPGRAMLAARLIGLAAFTSAAALSALTATWGADRIEALSRNAVRKALAQDGIAWAEVSASGMNVTISGEAPTEALRFRALGLAGGVIDTNRVIDAMTVPDPAAIRAPDYSVEILRNDDGISLIGLVPASTDRAGMVAAMRAMAGGPAVTDMLETAAYPAPQAWEGVLAYGLRALQDLPRSKISLSATRIAITAITDSAAQKAALENRLRASAPQGPMLVLEISAPRPVITPFTLRMVIEAGKPRFDACSADTDRARSRILAAARESGMQGELDCTLGMGTPSPAWSDAAIAAIRAMRELGAGSVTLSDTDVSLIAADSVAQADFDRVAGELDTALPPAFSLTAVLTPPPDAASHLGPPEFTAALSDRGRLQIRGRLADDRARAAIDSFARARFGSDNVYVATRQDGALPEGWSVKTLAALEALDQLNQGRVLVRPDLVRIEGLTGNRATGAEIARLLSSQLGEGQEFDIRVDYDPRFDPSLALPSAAQCLERVNAVLAQGQITFEPGSAEFSGQAAQQLDRLAEALKDCADYPIEVSGHTDSQGRDEMNLALSEDRAEAVVAALMARRVLTANLHPRGYGETRPVADNANEAGREANRRIEFTLMTPEAGAEGEVAKQSEGEGAALAQDGQAPVSVSQAQDDTARPAPRPEGLVPEGADSAENAEGGAGDADLILEGSGDEGLALDEAAMEGSGDEGSGDEGSGDEGSGDGPLADEAAAQEDLTPPPAAGPKTQAEQPAAPEGLAETLAETPAEAGAEPAAAIPAPAAPAAETPETPESPESPAPGPLAPSADAPVANAPAPEDPATAEVPAEMPPEVPPEMPPEVPAEDLSEDPVIVQTPGPQTPRPPPRPANLNTTR